MKKICIIHHPRSKKDFLVFISQFTEVFVNNGYKYTTYKFFPHIIRVLAGKFMRIFKIHFNLCHTKTYLVPMCGIGLDTGVIPWGVYAEIIPFLWDCWPHTHKRLLQTIKVLNCKLVFVTSRQTRDIFSKELPHTKVIYIPEGIDIQDYNKGDELINRKYNVIEIGRQHPKYHSIIKKLEQENKLSNTLHNEYKNGKLIQPIAKNLNELSILIRSTKIAISFPHCDTNPTYTGGIETLTQRYWESMLSRNLIIGRAPQELIDLIGYNPVINVDWSNPEQQLLHVLERINDYQSFVDKNYETALKYAGWDKRLPIIEEALKVHGYVK